MINSRAKGAAFENKLCKMIRETFDVDKQHCYRTPLSGGHQAYCRTAPGDILISPELWERFPFVIEAKHRKDWTPISFHTPRTKLHESWIRHLFKDLKMTPKKNAMPLLLCRGANTKIYAALRTKDFSGLGLKTPQNYLVFTFQREAWIQLLATEFLSMMYVRHCGGK